MHYALVGLNGVGKTTIIKLMLGLYPLSSGRILLNEKDLSTIPYHEIISYFSVLFQDFARFGVTLRENIILDQPFDYKRYHEIITLSDLNEVINSLPQQDETILGKMQKGGEEISGGQWQKVALARMLYDNRQIFILDEPTASLDPLSETELYHKYFDLCKDKTTIFISHRLASTRLANKILVLSDGKIVEFGTYDELIQIDGLYAKMFQAQKKWYWGDENGEKKAQK